ncbi:MAG TPA: universal stress protein [Gaiellaceae bacterium]|nr:universal stress protein [Gaiellaceae bacterium]
MRPRILCAFDSPAGARLAVPRAVELAAWRDADLSFLALVRPSGSEPCGPVAPQRIRRRSYLSLALARAAETAAGQLGRRPRIGLLDTEDLDAEVRMQAVAQGADEVFVAETAGFWRRPRLRRLSLQPVGAPLGVRLS